MLKTRKNLQRYVRRAGSDKFLLLMLISFAISVSLTRAFLNLTGFPQLGTGGLHIAHVVWGGLILFVAAIFPLIYANRRVYQLVAILTGLGMGLFIDEIGKFITQNNDYFFPPAAPLIYAFFLLSALLYARIKHTNTHDDRTELYHALDLVEEILDEDLDAEEKAELISTLDGVKNDSSAPEYRRLAEELIRLVSIQRTQKRSRNVYLLDWMVRLSRKIIAKISDGVLRTTSTIALLGLGISMLIFPIRFYLASAIPADMTDLMLPLIRQELITSPREVTFFTIRLFLEVATGLTFILSGFLLFIRREKAGINLASVGMLLTFTVVDLLVFYYDQFSTIFFVTIQLFVLLWINIYRQRIKSAAINRG